MWRTLFATTLASGVLVTATAQAAHAQTIVHTFANVDCLAVVGVNTLHQIQDVTIGIVAPDSVTPGQTFTITLPGGTAALPTRSNGLSISSYSNLFQTVQLNGANFNSGSATTSGPASFVPATLFASSWSTLSNFPLNAYVYINEAPPNPPLPAPPNPPDYHFFRSKIAGNLNHPPATSPTQWLEVPLSEVTTWQSVATYGSGTYTSDAGVTYKSLVAANLNHPPATSPVQWQVVASTTTPQTATLLPGNQLQFGTPGPVPTGNPSDPATLGLTTPDVTVQATAPASGQITLNMVSLTTHLSLNNGALSADATCAVPNDTILTIPVQTGPSNLSVDAGADVSTSLNTAVTLNGSFVDPDATPTLSWGVDSPFCSFTDATIAAPDITCTHGGTFVATLSAHDGINADTSDSALVTVTTPNQPPVVNAGPDKSGHVNDDIDLNGTVTDSDSDPSILWTVDNNVACGFDDETAADTTISCDTPGVYAITLTADDGVNAPVSDMATVTITAAPPGLNANAGPDKSGNVNTAISLAGSVSDPGFTPTVHWTSDSPMCNFANANAAVTTITCGSSGVFAAILTAHDGTHPDSVDVALVTVIAPNSPPLVNSGGNVIGKPNIAIPLHGTVVDPGDTPTNHWASDSPNCTFGNATLADTTVTCNAVGVYAATLTAADGVNPPVMATAIVTIVSNFPPTVDAGPDVAGNTNTPIALHGTVGDSDSAPTIQWVTGSPNCTFGNPSVADTTITCTVGGNVAATLTANDGVNATVSDTALVSVAAPNAPPVVSAGPDLTESVGHNATLNGSVTDDGSPTLHWATGNPACSFGSPNTAVTTFVCTVPGIFAATLTASDGVNPPVSSTALVTFVPGLCTKPCVSVGDAIAYEGGAVALPIVLSSPQTTAPVTVTATIIPITAGNCRVTPASCDFKSTAVHNITFRAGNRFKYVSVTALTDGLVEGGDHTFEVVLSNVVSTTGVTIGRGLGTGTIRDATGMPANTYLVGSSTIPEMDACATCKATAKISVALSSNPAGIVNVTYHTANAGATAGSDYTSKSGTLTYKAGATLKKYISVITLGDNIVDTAPLEGIDVVFTNVPAGYSVVGAGHIDILDND